MSKGQSALSQRLFDFCYRLYLDPVYRYICFPPDRVAGEASLSREAFLSIWQALSGMQNDEGAGGMEKALNRVIATVCTLNPVEQDVLLLRYGADLPYRQIAEQVDRSEGACHVIHYRALSEFCERLAQPEDYGHV